MKHLYFVRHGQSEMNKAGRWAGKHTETPLTEEGRQQARLAGDYALTLSIDHIVSSPQIRARDTALIIAEAISFPAERIEYNALFAERGYGILEGTRWMPGMNVDDYADVETIHTFHRRIHWAYELLQSMPHDNILVVSHGAVGKGLRYILHTVHDRQEPFVNHPFKYGEIIQLL